MESLFVRSLLRDAVLVQPQLIGSNFDAMIESKLKAAMEGVCSRHGYIMPGSVSLHRVISSKVEAVSFNGDVKYDVAYHASVCNPPIGAVLPARVVNMNRFGLLTHSGLDMGDGTFVPVVESIAERQAICAPPSEVDLDAVEIGDSVFVEIVGKKFELMDDKISVIGRLVTKDAHASWSNDRAHDLDALGAISAGALTAKATPLGLEEEDGAGDVTEAEDESVSSAADEKSDVEEDREEEEDKSGGDESERDESDLEGDVEGEGEAEGADEGGTKLVQLVGKQVAQASKDGGISDWSDDDFDEDGVDGESEGGASEGGASECGASDDGVL